MVQTGAADNVDAVESKGRGVQQMAVDMRARRSRGEKRRIREEKGGGKRKRREEKHRRGGRKERGKERKGRRGKKKRRDEQEKQKGRKRSPKSVVAKQYKSPV